MKPYSLFIDDIRSPKTDAPVGDWIITRTLWDVLQALATYGVPSYVSFDHDLGDSCDAFEIAKTFITLDQAHITEHGIPFLPTTFSYNVHSSNLADFKSISSLLDNYLIFRRRKLLKNAQQD